ncbi:hypothetical protein ACFC06_25135 [Nocardia sp. NPDC056064]|uniref:hypothetical protein n=1 Tax=Nocardia sp. NPDC056064 TaxID=3345701 RepID=UPI0035DD1283
MGIKGGKPLSHATVNAQGVQIGGGNTQNNNFRISPRWIVFAVVVVGLLVATSILVYGELYPQRVVNANKALAADRDEFDATVPPVRVSAVRGPERKFGSVVSESAVDLDGADVGDGSKVLQERGATSSVASRLVVLTSAEEMQVEDTISFKITGLRNKPAVISSLAVKVLSRRPAPSGTVIAGFPQGVADAIEAGVDLNQADVVEAKVLGDPYYQLTDLDFAKENTITLAKDETLSFNLLIIAGSCVCDFEIAVEFLTGDIVTIDMDGEPFTIVGLAPKYEMAFTHRQRADGSGNVLRPCNWPKDCAYSFAAPDK